MDLGEPHAEVRGLFQAKGEAEVGKDKAGSLATEYSVASAWAFWECEFDYGKEKSKGWGGTKQRNICSALTTIVAVL